MVVRCWRASTTWLTCAARPALIGFDSTLIELGSQALALTDVWAVAQGAYDVQLADAARERITASRVVVEDLVATDQIVYGVTTGFGDLASKRIAHGDLQQRVAVEFGCERLADTAHRALQPRALTAQVLQALGELARHLVELLAELGELVLAGRGDVGGEVAAAQAPRGLQEGADLRLQRARHRERGGQRQREEAREDERGLQARAAGVARALRLGRDDHDLERGAAPVRRAPRDGALGLARHLDVLRLAPARRVGRLPAERARQHDAVADEHDVGTRGAARAGGEAPGRRRRGLEHPEALPRRPGQVAAAGRDRVVVADVEDDVLAARQRDAFDATPGEHLARATARAIDVVADQ